MVEVFKTNVYDPGQANMLIDMVGQTFINYIANFDLEDCDKILRIESNSYIQASRVIDLLKDCGFEAEVLPDNIPNHIWNF